MPIRLLILAAGLLLASVAAFAQGIPASEHAPKTGQKAPDFTLPVASGSSAETASLSTLLAPEPGRPAPWTLLVFYRGYW